MHQSDDFTTKYWSSFDQLWTCFLDYMVTLSSDVTWAALFSQNKRAMIANFSQVQLSFSDVDQHPGICKGQLGAEKEQHQCERQHLHGLFGETSLPAVLGACSRNSEWVRYFLLSQSEKTMAPLCLRGQSEVILCSLRQPSLVTFGLYASWWVMSQELHNKTVLEKTLAYFSSCRPDLPSLGHASVSYATTNQD